MNLDVYTPKALSTALPSALNMDYLAPGLIAELGEIFDAYAKAVRDDWAPDALGERIKAETGDVCWFLALIIHELAEYRSPDVSYDMTDAELPPLIRLLHISARIELLCTEAPNPLGYALAEPLARQGWDILAAHSQSWTGVPFSSVLRANVQKLADRAARKVISGSGDNR